MSVYFKCADCWRVFSFEQVSTGYFAGCKCGSIKFYGRKQTLFNRLKNLLGRLL